MGKYTCNHNKWEYIKKRLWLSLPSFQIPYICITITLYARQKKRHRCIEQTFGLYGRRRRWGDLREQHRNMYIIKYETDLQSRLDAWDKCLGLVHWDDPEGWDGEGGGRGGSGWGTHVNPWLIHVNVWQKPLQYCKVISLQLVKIVGDKK